MKALLLRVGIDKGCGGTLAPIFDDGSFEYLPIPERFPAPDTATYHDRIGRKGKRLSTYVPQRVKNAPMHEDPEFHSNTYGDPSLKRYYLLKLEKGDLLVFYAGLRPFRTQKYQEALYIIAHFPVKEVTDFNTLSDEEREACSRAYSNNAHLKRHSTLDNLVIVAGTADSKLLETAMLISRKKPNKAGRLTDALSAEMERLLGISGFVERSMPPRFVLDERNVAQLAQRLDSA